MNAIVINKVNVEFEAIKNEVFINSLQVAEVFEKRHSDILRAIDALPQDEFTKRNFALSEYTDSTGRKLPMYKMTRDGFSMLVMGFTGEKAYGWKIDFIKAFNMMEAELRSKFAIPQDFGEALRLAADLADENRQLAFERDEAVKTKAWISSKREASAVGKLGAVKKENIKLKGRLDLLETHATIKKVAALTHTCVKFYNTNKLKKYCEGNKLSYFRVPDDNYAYANSYHKDAWAAIYGIDITKLGKEILKRK